MPRPSKQLGENLARNTRSILRYRSKIEALYRSRHMTLVDVERAYGGALVEHYMICERTVEDLFCGLLSGRLVSGNRSVRPLVSVNSDAVARRVVRGERPYVDWFPWQRYTQGRAEAFFSTAAPFASLTKSDRGHLEEYGWIRNAIAHRSQAAVRIFTARLITSRGIVPAQQRPAQFLRGSHASATTRFEYYVVRTSSIIEGLCA
jgi:hypothetical protein